jgi:long-chain acyl-CoA synthetase
MALTVLDTNMFDTWPKVLQHNADAYGARHTAIRYKHYGIWQSYSWRDYLDSVKYLALGLLALGFKPGDKLLVIGDSAPEWYYAELAAQSIRGVSVGLYSDLSAIEIEHVARDSGAQFAMVEDQEQADKIESVRDRLPALKAVIYWRYKGLSRQAGADFIGLRSVMEMGRAYEVEHPGVFEQNVAAGSADDLCALIYTSGTTGHPKGTMHSYRSLMAGSLSFSGLNKLTHKDRIASFLPPAWMNEQLLAFGCHLVSGGTVDFAEDAETQQTDVRETAPSVVVYNSRLWESLAGQARARMRSASRLKRQATHLFMPIGLKVADVREQGRKPSLALSLAGALGDLLVFGRIRGSLGLPHARVCYSSGCTLSSDTMRFFQALRVPLKNVYVSAEAGAVTGVAGRVQARGTVGSVHEGVEVKRTDRGELSVRHPGVFLGYHNDPEATARVLDGGWVLTGDHCELIGRDVVFVDRLDDLIVMACGDVVAPQEIESRLKYSPYIRDAWVLSGPDCGSLSAVIIVDAGNTGHWADKNKVTFTTFGDLSQKPEVYKLVEQDIAFVNESLPEAQRIRRFVNLHKEFDPDESELTRNRKLRRAVLSERYADLVAALAGGVSTVEVEAEVTYQDGRTGSLKTAVNIGTIGAGV